LFVDTFGRVNVMWVIGAVRGQNWQGPESLTPEGTASPGANIALAHQESMVQLDALFLDKGRVNVMWAVGLDKWQGPVALT